VIFPKLFREELLGFSNFYSASALLAMQSAVLARGILSVCLSVRLSFRHVPVLCPDQWRYDRAVFSIWLDNPSSFWRGKVYPDIRRGSPSAGALKWGTPLSIGKIRQIIGYNLETVQDMTNRKLHMGFRLVPKWITLNDLEWRNAPIVCVISPNSVAFGPYYAKVVEDTRIHSASEM